MDPPLRSDMKEFLRICERLTHYLTEKEREELAGIVYVVRRTTRAPYDEIDDLSASLTFAKLFPFH